MTKPLSTKDMERLRDKQIKAVLDRWLKPRGSLGPGLFCNNVLQIVLRKEKRS